MKLINFERLKHVSNKKNIFILVCFTLLLLSGAFYLNASNRHEKENLRNQGKSSYVQLMQLQSISDTELIPLYQKAMDSLNKHWELSSSNNWKESLKAHIDYLDNLTAIQEQNGMIPSLGFLIGDEKVANVFFLNNNIQPETPLFSLTGTYYLRTVLQAVFSIISGLVIALLFFDLFSLEFENKSISLLYTFPVKRKQLIATKEKFAFTTVVGYIGMANLLALALGTIISKSLGSWYYPVDLVVEKGIARSFPFYQYLCLSFYIYLYVLLFQVKIIKWWSLILRKSINTLFVTITTFCLPSLLIKIFFQKELWATWIPFYYFDVHEIVILNFENQNINILILRVTILFLLIFTFEKFLSEKSVKLFEV